MWLFQYIKYLLMRFVINVIKCGPTPKHVAFIMDGNRRYAREHNLKEKVGYKLGMRKMETMLELCDELGIKEVSIYAFSLENFKRSDEEVGTLMKLAEDYSLSIDENHIVMKLQIQVRLIGDIDRLPLTTRIAISKGIRVARHNKRLNLNIVAPYTSREEITTAIRAVADGVRSGALKTEDITEQLISDCLYTNHSSNPDMLIRTSGETRLSDFLLWQTGFTQIFFLKPLWQNLSYWDVLKMILRFQRNYEPVKKIEQSVKPTIKKHNARIQQFLKDLDKAREGKIINYANATLN